VPDDPSSVLSAATLRALNDEIVMIMTVWPECADSAQVTISHITITEVTGAVTASSADAAGRCTGQACLP
jgi:hypothetical protein